MTNSASALLVVPPLSPSDTNPPLGPAIIAQTAYKSGVDLRVHDLNIRYLNGFRSSEPTRSEPITPLGDHAKDRDVLARAKAHYRDAVGLQGATPTALPIHADPVLGMHYDFDTIRSAVREAAETPGYWRSFLDEQLGGHDRPHVAGISVMGPTQVFAALVTAAYVKNVWPSTRVVFGGSHITLLSPVVLSDPAYSAGVVDEFMFGHCEVEFVSALQRTRATMIPRRPLDNASFEIQPLFDAEWLGLFPETDTVLPVQFTRGCSYGKCAYCTYPVVEPLPSRLAAPEAANVMVSLWEQHRPRGISLKDSLFSAAMLDRLSKQLSLRGAPVQWSATTKVSARLAESAQRYRAAGLATLELGVESVAPAAQAAFRKPQPSRLVARVVQELAEAGISVVVNLMFGWPGSSDDDALEQIDWFLNLRSRSSPGMVSASVGRLEIQRRTPLAKMLNATEIAPWAESYSWDAPVFRQSTLTAIESLNGMAC